jgi:hypothetical protein
VTSFQKITIKSLKQLKKILADLGIETEETNKGNVIDLKGVKVGVEVTSVKGKINAKNKKINQLSRFIEEQKKNEKVIFVAKTYNELPIEERRNREHITPTMRNFIKTIQTSFLTTLTLYDLWMKVRRQELTNKEASSVILNTNGEVKL